MVAKKKAAPDDTEIKIESDVKTKKSKTKTTEVNDKPAKKTAAAKKTAKKTSAKDKRGTHGAQKFSELDGLTMVDDE